MAAIAILEKRVQKTIQYSFDEYLRKEEKALHKHEFYNGQIIKMSGAKFRHNQAATNISSALVVGVKKLKKKHFVLNSDQKVFIEQENVALYPDALVVCETPIFWQEREDIIINPLVVVEVLSRGTAAFDRNGKFFYYKSLPSFREYVLINPDKISVDIWYQKTENTWEMKTFNQESDILNFQSLEISVAMTDIYFGLTFPTKLKI